LRKVRAREGRAGSTGSEPVTITGAHPRSAAVTRSAKPRMIAPLSAHAARAAQAAVVLVRE
jgi:hypothetical protein